DTGATEACTPSQLLGTTWRRLPTNGLAAASRGKDSLPCLKLTATLLTLQDGRHATATTTDMACSVCLTICATMAQRWRNKLDTFRRGGVESTLPRCTRGCTLQPQFKPLQELSYGNA